MADTNTDTIEREVKGEKVFPDFVVTDSQKEPIETGNESFTPHPENYYSNNLKPPTTEEVSTMIVPKEEFSNDTAIGILTSVGYEIDANRISDDSNPALPIKVAQINNEPISKY